jgi:hypothetical protein
MRRQSATPEPCILNPKILVSRRGRSAACCQDLYWLCPAWRSQAPTRAKTWVPTAFACVVGVEATLATSRALAGYQGRSQWRVFRLKNPVE